MIGTEIQVGNVGPGAWDASRDVGETLQHTLVLRLGSECELAQVTALPQRYRERSSQSQGRLGQAFLHVTTHEVWCRLNSGLAGQIWPLSIRRIEVRILALSDAQPSTPPPDAIALTPHMPVDCRDGFVGKLAGIVVGTSTGLATALLVHLSANLDQIVSSPDDPLVELLPFAGRNMMLPPTWAKTVDADDHRLKIDATAAQVAHGLVLRDDGDILQAVWAILTANRALAPFVKNFDVQVVDGYVTVSGPLLAPRLRSSLEQDVWHIPGVLGVRTLVV